MSSPSASRLKKGKESTTVASRRKRPEQDHEDALRETKKQRLSYACSECYRRKQKCDRQMPCSQCISRKVPDQCTPYNLAVPKQELHERMSRLEKLFESDPTGRQVLGRADYPTSLDGQGSGLSRVCDDEDNSSGDESPPDDGSNSGFYESGEWFGAGAWNMIFSSLSDVFEKLSDASHSTSRDSPGDTSSVSTDDIEQVDLKDFKQPLFGVSAEVRLQTLVRDHERWPHKFNLLPPRTAVDQLIDCYFSSLNWVRYPISERAFRASCTSIYEGNIATDPNAACFLPLFFIVLAISARYSPQQSEIGSKKHKPHARYYYYYRRTAILASSVQPYCMDLVVAHLLSTRYLIQERNVMDCWNNLGEAIRIAQAAGLHREPASLLQNITPKQLQYRRLIWSYIYHADRRISLILGRPTAIQDSYTSTRPPLNIQNDDSDELQAPLPMTVPTNTTYIVLRHSLAGILGRIIHHFQKVNASSRYEEVLALDNELVNFLQTLPPHYSLDPDTSLDSTLRYIVPHRFYIVVEVLHARIALHRPYLMRGLKSDRYRRSREVCLECVLLDFHIRKSFINPQEFNGEVKFSYGLFQTAMVAGIYLTLYPGGQHAALMRDILEYFIQDRTRRQSTEIRVHGTTLRELRIIMYLKAKSATNEDQTRALSLPRPMPSPSDFASSTEKYYGDTQAFLSHRYPNPWAFRIPSPYPEDPRSASSGPLVEPDPTPPSPGAFVGMDDYPLPTRSTALAVVYSQASRMELDETLENPQASQMEIDETSPAGPSSLVEAGDPFIEWYEEFLQTT